MSARKPASPGRPHKAPASVRLSPDVRDALGELAHTKGTEVDKMVNEALRAWISSQKR